VASATPGFFQNGNARQLLALQVLQRRTAAGRDVPERVTVQTQLTDGGRGVAATDDRQALGRGNCLGHALGPGRERRHLEHAHRAVPEDGLCAGKRLGEGLHGRRPDVETLHTCGYRVGGDRLGRRVVADAVGDHDVDRQDDLVAGLVEEPLAVADLILLEQRATDFVTLRREEREAHPAADQQPVDLRQQRLDDGELVAHLGAAEHDDVRTFRLAGQLLEHLELVTDEVAAVVRQHGRDVVDRCVLAVHRAERVLDEGATLVVATGEEGETAGELGPLMVVLARLARVEPDVLEKQQLAVLEVCGEQPRALPHRVEGELDRSAEQLGEAVGYRAQRVRGIGRALRPAEVCGDDDPCPVLEQPGVGRQRGTDPSVVGNPAVLERDVQVGADQDPPTLDPVLDQIVKSAHQVRACRRRAGSGR
jgi:hypothetical protein